jgi:hypothetical protein
MPYMDTFRFGTKNGLLANYKHPDYEYSFMDSTGVLIRRLQKNKWVGGT